MSQSLKRVLFGVPLVILVSYPILDPKLCAVGTKLEALSAGAQILWTIAAAVLAMFVRRLFRDHIPFRLGRGVGYKINDSDLKNFLSLPSTRRWVVLALVVVALVRSFFASRGTVDITTLVLVYAMLGIGLSIAVGLIDLLDLGHVGLYAVGVYTYALLVECAGFGFWTTLPIVGMMAALFGFPLGFPVLRLYSDYLAIVTPGFDEIVRVLLRNMIEITDSPNSIGSIPKPTPPDLTLERHTPEGIQIFHEFFGIAYNANYKVILFYVMILLLVLLALFVINRLMRMSIGRTWGTLHKDEVVCRVPGLNPIIVKLSTFTINASFAGFADSFSAARRGLVTLGFFTFIESTMILAIVVLGGMGSQSGVIPVVVVMVLLQEMRGFNEYCMLIFGLTMIMTMIWRPQRLLPMQRPYLELEPWADRFSK